MVQLYLISTEIHYSTSKSPSRPLPEQKRIAEILDKADELRAKRKEALAQLDSLVQSTFLEMFGVMENNNNSGDKLKKISEICYIRGGGTPSKSNPLYYTGNIPWISPKDMKNLYITTSIDKITEEAVKESSTVIIPKNSVLMVIRSGILKNKLPVAINKVDVAINQDMKAFNSSIVLPEYLMYYFKSIEKKILTKIRGTTADNINFEDIRSMDIPLPPPHLQQKFATIVQSVERQKESMRAQLQEMDTLFASLQDRAFKGEL